VDQEEEGEKVDDYSDERAKGKEMGNRKHLSLELVCTDLFLSLGKIVRRFHFHPRVERRLRTSSICT